MPVSNRRAMRQNQRGEAGDPESAPATRQGAVEWRLLRVSGVVQGIGFRPTVYRLARRHGLAGEIRNTAHGVEIVAGGPAAAIRRFVTELPNAVPLPGCIERIEEAPAAALADGEGFSIAPSIGDKTIEVVIPPDQATCPDCLRELLEPGNRRFGYPLITCTVCGPRYSIIEQLPYDRERTTMRRFPLCGECRTEYEDPEDRRFHAESIACAHCGPNVELIAADGPIAGTDPMESTIDALRAGRIVAIKGIGGYHLACDATNEEAIAELRRRKNRPHKPFAVLVRDLDAARRVCAVGEAEAALLASPEAPIVLLKRLPPPSPSRREGEQTGRALPDNLAPDNDRLGLMLPYTPIQHLLARRFEALVMTSGNVTDEPIRHTEDSVRDLLKNGDRILISPNGLPQSRQATPGNKFPVPVFLGFQPVIADFALVHSREIVNPSDDSVFVVQRGAAVPIRRARGHVPAPLEFDADLPPILAVGADLKNACAFGRGRRVYFSPHIGDLEYPAAFDRHVEEIERFAKWFGVTPRAVACDLHPGYHSTQHAHRLAARWDARLIEVQHHHAHVAACLAEHGVEGEVIGVAFDGTGYGADGTVWGGEFLVASRKAFRRAGRLACHSLPGGERSIHEPWRMLAACLVEQYGSEQAAAILRRHVAGPIALGEVTAVLGGPVRTPQTSSMGRLFDAVGVLLGFATAISFEAQNAMAVESLCGGDLPDPYRFEFRSAAPRGPDDAADLFEIDLRGLFDGIVADLEAGTRRETIAGRFHAAVVEMIVGGCRRIRDQTGLTRVALSGGCFVNTVLVEGAAARLEADGFEVLLHRRVPPNDGGVALGQIAVAAAALGLP